MTNGDDFRKYHCLQRKLLKELGETMDSDRFKELLALRRRCFPTKEEVIETVEAFYQEGS